MRAVVIREPGGPEVLDLRQVPSPAPGPGQLRVRVAFSALNRADLLQRAGFYPAPPGSPADIPGLEYSGTVDAIGPGVTLHKEGDRVMGLVGGGAYAEQLVVHEREAVAVPAALSLEQAAALPEAFVTAYDALAVRGRLQPGERVLIHAVASGVGTAGLQIARSLGCAVVGTSRSADKLDRCRPLGLDHGLVPGAGPSFASEVRSRLGGRGVDVVLDLVGGPYLPETLLACALGARVVVVGLTAGPEAPVNLGLLLRQRLEIIGTVLRSRPLEEKIEAAHLLARRIVPLLEAGRLAPVIDRTFALTEVADAHRYLAANESLGKVLLAVNP